MHIIVQGQPAHANPMVVQGKLAQSVSHRGSSAQALTAVQHCTLYPAMATSLPYHVDSLAKEALASESPAVVESLLEAMQKTGISKTIRIHPSKIITHPKNRYGCGVTPEDVHESIDDIIQLRWNDSLFKGLCTDVPHQHRDEWLRFNTEMVAGSRELLAPVDVNAAEFAALRGNHTVSGHRCILASGKHDSDPDITEHGLLSYSKVINKCPSMELPLTIGAQWTFIPSRFLEAYPGLDCIIQATGNFMNNTAKAESDIQILAKVQARMSLGFDNLKRSLDANRVKNMSALPGMFQFVRKFAGGANLKYFDESQSFIRGLLRNAKPVNYETWDALTIDWKGAQQCIELRYGMLKLLYLEPGLITETDIKKFNSKDKERLEKGVVAQSIVEQFRDRINTHTQNQLAMQVFGQFQMAAAALVLDKRTVWMKNIYKLYDVSELSTNIMAWCATNELASFIVDQAQLPSAYNEFKLNLKAVAAAEQAEAGGAAVRAAGDQTDALLTEMGFAIGMHVTCKKYESKVFKITSWAEGTVCLQDIDTCKVIQVGMVDLQDKEWTQYKKKLEEWVMGNSSATYQVHETQDFKFAAFRAKCLLAMEEHVEKQSDLAQILKVCVAPSKAVEVTEDIAKGKLLISPASLKVKCEHQATGKADQSIDVYKQTALYIGSTCHDKKTYRVYILGVPSIKAIKDKSGVFAPFWSVDTTEVQDESNCNLSESTINIKLSMDNPEFKIPYIVNTKALKKGDKIKLFIPKAKATLKRKTPSK